MSTETSAGTPVAHDAPPADAAVSTVLPLLRMLALVLVLLGQAWLLVRTTAVTRYAPLDGILGSLELGWTLLWVATGYAVVRGLDLAAARSESGAPVVLGHLARVGLAVLGCLVAVAAVARLTDAGGTAPVRQTLEHVLTFTWNWALLEQPTLGRIDLVPLRYFSIEVQALAVVVLAHVIFRPWPRVRFVLGLAGVVAAAAWRVDLVAGDQVNRALLETWARGDAVLWGALAAWAVPWFARRQPWSASLSSAAVLPLLVMPLAVSFVDDAGRLLSVLVPLAACLAAVALAGDGHGRMTLERFGRRRVVTALAERWWLLVALWGPVALGVADLGAGWPGLGRVLMALVVLGALVVTVEQLLVPGLAFAGRFFEALVRPAGATGEGSAQVGDEERGTGGDPTAQA